MPNPPAIDRALMLHLADLARLHIPAERLPSLRARLERIVSAFSALQTVDGVSSRPAPAFGDLGLPTRPDVAGAPLAPAIVLQNAPQQAGGSFVVPRVIEA